MLLNSSDRGDVLIGLQFIRDWRYKDVKEMFPHGFYHNTKKLMFHITRYVDLKDYDGYYKLHHGLYMALYTINYSNWPTSTRPRATCNITFSCLPFVEISHKTFLI